MRYARRPVRPGPVVRTAHHAGTAVLALALLAVLASVVGAASGWWRVVPVLSGSMEPGIRTGGVVAARPIPTDQIGVGDVILFQAPTEDRHLVVHRVAERQEVDGVIAFRTKGDANGGPDPWLIQVSGEQVYRVVATAPFLGRAALWLVDPSMRAAVFAVIGLCIVGVGLRMIWRRGSDDDTDHETLDEPRAPDLAGPEPGTGRLRLRPAMAAVAVVVIGGLVIGDAASPAGASFRSSPAAPASTYTTGTLTAPGSFSCRWNTASQVQVDWTDSTGGFASSTSVERANALAGPYSSIGSTAIPASTFLDNAPGAGTARWYRAVGQRSTWSGTPTAATRNGDCRYGVKPLASGFSGPVGGAYDAAGNLYVADSGANLVRKVAPDGTVTTVAGGGGTATCSFSGSATAVQLSGPKDVAVDAAGNVYIADTGNRCIRKVAGSTISRVAGGGTTTTCATANVAVANVGFSAPVGVAVDRAGTTVYVSDTGHDCVRVISAGLSNRFAGGGSNTSCTFSGSPTAVSLVNPTGIALSSTGALFITDPGNQCLRKVSAGTVSSVAGATSGTASTCSSTVAPASFRFATSQPVYVALDASDRPYVVQSSQRCVTLFSGGAAVPVAGTGTSGNTGDDGKATSATFNNPQGVAVNPTNGDVAVVDTGNNRVREVAQPG